MTLAVTLILLAVIVSINYIYIRKNGLYQYATKHIEVYSFLVAFLIVYLFLLGGISQIKNRETLNEILVNVLCNYVVALCIFIFFGLEKTLKNLGEDKEKQRHDYDALAEEYSEETGLVSRADKKHYPVVNIGSFDICIFRKKDRQKPDNNGTQTDDELERIVIIDSPNLYQLPGIIENNFSNLMSVHDTSTLYNNLNIRVKKMEYRENQLHLETERTFYFYSLVTNRAPDFAWGGLTVRELFEPAPKLQRLESSVLSNHLGFNGFVESSDGYFCFVKRSHNVSVGKRTWGDSIEASLKTKYALNENGKFTQERLRDAILHEIEDELKIKKENCSTVRIIGIYRDVVEAGKPQLLVYAKTELCAKRISMEFYHATMNKGADPQKESRRAKEKQVLEDGSRLIWIRKTDLLTLKNIRFDEHGIHAPTLTYIFSDDPNRTEPDKKNVSNPIEPVEKKMFLPMVPSASAAVIMLRDHLQLSPSSGDADTSKQSIE